MPFGLGKIKVTREEFAQVLFVWLMRCLSEDQIKEIFSKGFDLKLKSDEDFDRLRQELFYLNMWLIVFTCEGLLKDIDRRNECLDIFHRIVYENLVEQKEQDFDQWLLSMGKRYMDYTETMDTEHELGPLWELTSLVNRNIYGELNLDAFVQFQLSAYVKSTMEALEGLIKRYNIK